MYSVSLRVGPPSEFYLLPGIPRINDPKYQFKKTQHTLPSNICDHTNVQSQNIRRGSHANFLLEDLQQASMIGCSVLSIFGIILLFVIIPNHDNLLPLFALRTMTPLIAFIRDRGRRDRERIQGDLMPSQGTEKFGQWKVNP